MSPALLDIIQSMSTVVMTIVGGVFAVQTAQTVASHFTGGGSSQSAATPAQPIVQPANEARPGDESPNDAIV
ncbi:hypothetical protein [Paenibacillus xylanexedens]|uniref:hypothetical protein n=1 Tax=Paenibacillus xylanexedens TaxID=528191 RepID=UPI00119CBCC1|nr:hypothetical protein [Paenibacillus xylanexedens]